MRNSGTKKTATQTAKTTTLARRKLSYRQNKSDEKLKKKQGGKEREETWGKRERGNMGCWIER